ncbi:MAG: hypothetical protein MHM6MM_006396 [Cercozoa sp. M6MM]
MCFIFNGLSLWETKNARNHLDQNVQRSVAELVSVQSAYRRTCQNLTRHRRQVLRILSFARPLTNKATLEFLAQSMRKTRRRRRSSVLSNRSTIVSVLKDRGLANMAQQRMTSMSSGKDESYSTAATAIAAATIASETRARADSCSTDIDIDEQQDSIVRMNSIPISVVARNQIVLREKERGGMDPAAMLFHPVAREFVKDFARQEGIGLRVHVSLQLLKWYLSFSKGALELVMFYLIIHFVLSSEDRKFVMRVCSQLLEVYLKICSNGFSTLNLNLVLRRLQPNVGNVDAAEIEQFREASRRKGARFMQEMSELSTRLEVKIDRLVVSEMLKRGFAPYFMKLVQVLDTSTTEIFKELCTCF